MNTKQRSLGYRRNLTAWVEMMRARQAAAEEAARSAEESSALISLNADGSSALHTPDGLKPELRTPEDEAKNERRAPEAAMSRFKPWMSHT